MYPTKSLYTELNVLPVKKIYLKITFIFLKRHSLLQSITHVVNKRYAKNYFFIKKKLKNPQLADILK